MTRHAKDVQHPDVMQRISDVLINARENCNQMRPGDLRRSRTVSANILTVVAALFVSVLIAEGISRLLPRGYYHWDYRYLFYSEGAVRNQNEYWTYRPNSWVRAIGAYNFVGGDAHIEYDTWFRTNNIGLVQSIDFTSGIDSVGVFGDSFTEGHGAFPWFYRLEKGVKEIPMTQGWQLLNFGFQGIGVPNWGAILSDSRDKFRIKKAVIVLIGDDWYRGKVVWDKHSLDCINSQAACYDNETWYGINIGASWQEVLETTKKRSQLRHGQKWSVKAEGFLQKNSKLYKILDTFIKTNDPAHINFARAQLKQAEENTMTMKNIITSLGQKNVSFVFVPKRDETERGTYSALSKQALESIQEIGVHNIVHCKLQKSDYMQWDGHPNQGGYDKLASCTMNALSKILH